MEKSASTKKSVSRTSVQIICTFESKRIDDLINELAELTGLKLVKDNLYIGKHGSYYIKTHVGFRLAKFTEIK